MTYELFKQSVGGDVSEDNPMEMALWAGQASRRAVGIVNDLLVDVRLAYEVEDGKDYYNLEITLETGRNWENKYNNKFGADAVFEKLVREYNLVENPDEDEMEEMQEAVKLRREDETQEAMDKGQRILRRFLSDDTDEE